MSHRAHLAGLNRMRLLLITLLVAACGRTNPFEGSMGGGSSTGGGAATGGGTATGGGGGQASCNTLPDDSPTYFPGCPGSGTCAGCDLLAGDGGVIVDGTYDVAADILWESACGSLQMAASHGTLVISAGTFQLVSTGPQALGPATPTVRLNGDFTADGGQMSFSLSCGTGDTYTQRYTSANGVLSLSGFPGLVGDPVFVKRP